MSDRLSHQSPSWFRPKTFVFVGIAITWAMQPLSVSTAPVALLALGAATSPVVIAEGRRLADEAARLAGQTDSLEMRGQAQAALAAADLARGEPAMARAAFEKAIAAFDRKGDVVSAAAARGHLAALDRLGAGTTT